ncbi:MAG: type II toxin-antitoxin system VapC family toxin [Rhodospirillales bacterium]|nr:type II toxin-antitoxin system VapC family toxin [Rhodospirillales bacterium]MDE0379335.1 type II toxin-antitoxin system VapC family toxin [Rhodospirillales bacterium]
MIAVDTSVLLRYLLHDDEAQAARADAVFDAGKTVLITDVVLAETVWTLSGRKYRLPKAGLVAVLERLFSEPNIRFEDDQVVWRALQAYRSATPADEARSTKGAGFADALVVFKAQQIASDSGERFDGVYTFDAAMGRLPHTAAL